MLPQMLQGFINNISADAKQKGRLDQRRQTLHLAMAIGMDRIGRAIRSPNGKKGQSGRHDVRGGMRSFRKHAYRTGKNTDRQFHQSKRGVGKKRKPGGSDLFLVQCCLCLLLCHIRHRIATARRGNTIVTGTLCTRKSILPAFCFVSEGNAEGIGPYKSADSRRSPAASRLPEFRLRRVHLPDPDPRSNPPS